MEKTLKINGLNCANCANKIELKLRDLPWIENANLNFTMGNLSIKINDTNSYSLPIMQQIVDDIENGVSLLENEKEENVNLFNGNKGFIKLLISLPLFFTGLFLGSYPIVQFALLGCAYIVSGWDVLFRAAKNIFKGNFLDEFFLMSIATIGAFVVGEVAEGVGVMIFFQLGEFIQSLAVGKSKRSIKSLMSIKPEFVRMENGEIMKPENVIPGYIIEVRPGEKIPVDGILYAGQTTVDTKTITGESMPRTLNELDTVLSGFVNISNVIKVKTTKTFKDSTISKILEMVQNETSKKTKTENFISRFSRIYTPIVVITALLIAALTPLFISSWSYNDSIYKALIFLVISCPCALVISVPLGYFGGIGRASKGGILIKGSTHLEALSSITKFAFDKTGTLTKGMFSVTNIVVIHSEAELLEAAYKVEQKSNHPIAQAITKFTKIADKTEPTTYKEVTGMGIITEYGTDKFIGGKKELLFEAGVKIPEDEENTDTTVYLAKNNTYLGKIILKDSIKPDVKDMVNIIGEKNIYMLTGDNKNSAEIIAKEAGIKNIAHSLLPMDKAAFIKKLGKDENILFVGDGINDAPVLAASDVGVSMGGIGSDAAIEASDIVIMTDEPSKVIEAVKIAKFTKKIIIGNIVMAIGFKVIIMGLGLAGITGLWLAIFADVGVGLLAVLNSIRTLNYKID